MSSLSKKCAFVYVTTHCNMACGHCYVGDKLKVPMHMPLTMLKEFLQFIRVLGYGKADFLGGEPLLYPHLLEAIDVAHSLGLKAYVSTNGTIAPEFLPVVENIAVSIDHVPNGVGVRSQVWDSQMTHNISMLKTKSKRLSFTTTLSNRNLSLVPEILEYARECKVDRIHFHYFTPLGNGRTWTEEVIDRKVYWEFTHWLERQSCHYPFEIYYQKKYMKRSEIIDNMETSNILYAGNKARDFSEAISIFPDGSCHFDPLFFDKPAIAHFIGNRLRFDSDAKELDALFAQHAECLQCDIGHICGGVDSAVHADPDLHAIHGVCDEDFFPVETTWKTRAGDSQYRNETFTKMQDRI